MSNDILNDIYIIDQIKNNVIEPERRIQLEVPVNYEYDYVDEEKEKEEPKRVIIIDL